MQDTRNLIRKRDIEYPKLIKKAIMKKDCDTASFWNDQLRRLTKKIKSREKNRKKNEKQYRKAN